MRSMYALLCLPVQFFIIIGQGKGIMLFFYFFEGIKLTAICVSSGMRQDRGREQANSNAELSVKSNAGVLEEKPREQCQCSLLF